MVDENGFRLNVGIILTNSRQQLFWGRRIGRKDAWQFPQGGIQTSESPEQAMYRELYEELGLEPTHIQLLGQTQNWLHYYLPEHLRRLNQKPLCIGQKQKWFLLQLLADETDICFDRTGTAEFTAWRWVEYWHPLQQVVAFKKAVYQHVLTEFEPLMKQLSC